MIRPHDSRPRLFRWAGAAVLAASGAALASVPTDPPIFSDPLDISNTYFPFVPGGHKELEGTEGHGSNQILLSAVDDYLTTTRTFHWNGADIATRILRETSYEEGVLVEVSQNYFAQATNGAVYYFGEVVNIYEPDGSITHGGSWLVGGPTLPTDPPGAGNASSPAVFMPANPERGDVWKPEDVFPIADETAQVKRVGIDLTVPFAAFEDVILVLETSPLDPIKGKKWYAPGIGVVKATSQDGEIIELVDSTFP